MRAVTQRRYGPPRDVLTVEEIDPPTIADDEVLVEVRAASVHADVWHVVTGRPRVLRLMGAGILRPSAAVPGTDAAGIVAEVGANVTRFAVGDEVFGETHLVMQWRNGGAYAEYAAMPEKALAHKPPGATFEEAATVPTAGLIVLANLPGGTPESSFDLAGRHVLINGALGGVGSIALQLAKAAGAHVTAVDGTDKLDVLGQLGADDTIDYTTTDVTTVTPDAPFALVFDVIGNHPYTAYRRMLAPDGRYVLIGHDEYGARGRAWLGSIPKAFGLMARAVRDPHLPTASFDEPDRVASMERLRQLLADGTLTPVVAHTFAFEDAAEALRVLAAGTARGRIVLVP